MFKDAILNEYYELYKKHIQTNTENPEYTENTHNILTQHGDITMNWKKNAEQVGQLINCHRIQLFKSIITELNKHTIPYFLSDGSALGCYRNGKIIPHDVDIDITISEEHIHDAINVLKQNLNPTHLHIQTLDRYSKIDWNENSDKFIDLCNNYENIAKKICVKYTGLLNDPKNHENIPDLFAVNIDIYTYRQNEEHMNINYKHKDINLTAINFPLIDIFPLKTALFENIEDISVVANPIKYLERAYGYIGPDCYWDKNTQRFCKII